MDYKKYAENLEAYEALDQITFEKNTPKDEVIKALIDNSNEKRKIALENNAILDEYLYKYIKNPELMDDEAAEKLDAFYKTFTPQPVYSYDIAIVMEATEVLYKYYAGKKDYNKTIEYMNLASIYTIYMDQHLDKAPENPYYNLVEALTPCYDQLNEEGKKYFLALYCRSITDRMGNNLYAKYEKVMNFLNEKNINADELPASGVAALNTYDFIREDFSVETRSVIFQKNYKSEFTKEMLIRVHDDLIRREKILSPIYKAIIEIYEPEYQYKLNKITLTEAIEQIKNLKIDTDEFPEEYKLRYLIMPYVEYLRFIQMNKAYSDEGLKKACQECIKKASEELSPYLHQTIDTTVNYIYLMLISTASEIIGLEEYLPILEKLTIMSNKSLFIHTRMVSELSLSIFDALYEKNPEYFTGVSGYDEEYVKNHRDELRELLYKSAMLHDFGKFFILDIIGNSSRKLTDYEFFLIQHHPLNMEDIYEAPPTRNEKVIMDVSRLHHLWYNAEGGYPKGYKQTENQPFVNIVSVADSIDAATDYIGRPYAKRKSVDDIVNEIISQKGTRYDPVIAELIEMPSAKEKIRFIIEELRSDINYEVYTKENE